MALWAERDDLVRRRQDRGRRPVVPFELDHGGAGEALGELEDVLHGGGPESVDRLGVVADHREVLRAGCRPHPFEDVGLQRVRVLVLVDQDVLEHRGELWRGRRGGRDRLPEQEKVVVVEDVLVALALGVGLEDLADPLGLVETPWVVALHDIGESLARVHGPRVDRGEGVLSRESSLPR